MVEQGKGKNYVLLYKVKTVLLLIASDNGRGILISVYYIYIIHIVSFKSGLSYATLSEKLIHLFWKKS